MFEVKVLKTPQAIFVGLNLIDIMLTGLGLTLGLVELNKMINIGANAFFALKLILSLILACFLKDKQIRVLNYVFLGICINNAILDFISVIIYFSIVV